MSGPAQAQFPDLAEEMQALVALDKIQVPPYPAVALQISKLIQQGDFGLEDLAASVSSDPALAAGLLRAANSAFYGRGKVATIPMAVARVGAKETARLALLSGLSDAGRREGALSPLRRQAWQSGVAGAAICQLLARRRKLPEEEAFVCGLLHDFGWLIAISAVEELLRRHPGYQPRPAAFWTALVDKFHVSFGAAMAARWKLPDSIGEVILRHHTHWASGKRGNDLIDVVVASDMVLELLGAGPGVTEEDLAGVPGLRPEEWALLANALPEIPTMIAAFDAEPQGPKEQSKIEPAKTTLPENFRPLQLGVQVVGPRRGGAYAMVCVATTGWVMVGTAPLPENQLVEVEIARPGKPLRLWARPTLDLPAGAQGHRLECKPFALGGAALNEWIEFSHPLPG